MSGVSRATASRALNGHARVSADVRTRVQMIADQLGYRPNSAARSLASGRAGVLGLVLPGGHLISAPYEAHLLEAVADAATASGQGLMLWMAATEPSQSLRDSFRTGFVDGVIISGVALGSPWVEDLLDGPHPCVLVGRHPSRADVPHIELTNEASASAAVDHLVAGGGRRIAIILGPAGPYRRSRPPGRLRAGAVPQRHRGRHPTRRARRLLDRIRLRGDAPTARPPPRLGVRLQRPDGRRSDAGDRRGRTAGSRRHRRDRLRRPADRQPNYPTAVDRQPGRRRDRRLGGRSADQARHRGKPPTAATTTTVSGPLVIRQSTRPVAGVGSDAAKHNQTSGVREDTTSRTPVAGSTSSGENRRATS